MAKKSNGGLRRDDRGGVILSVNWGGPTSGLVLGLFLVWPTLRGEYRLRCEGPASAFIVVRVTAWVGGRDLDEGRR